MGLALLVGRELLGTVLGERQVQALGARHSIPTSRCRTCWTFFSLRFQLSPS